MRSEDGQQEGIWKETSVVYTRVIYLPGNTTNITTSEDNWCGGHTELWINHYRCTCLLGQRAGHLCNVQM
jgi:hypothetical protein